MLTCRKCYQNQWNLNETAKLRIRSGRAEQRHPSLSNPCHPNLSDPCHPERVPLRLRRGGSSAAVYSIGIMRDGHAQRVADADACHADAERLTQI